MKKYDDSAVKKLAVVALAASFMCIATACAGSDNMENDAYYDNRSGSANDYVNSVTNGTDRYNSNTGGSQEMIGDDTDSFFRNDSNTGVNGNNNTTGSVGTSGDYRNGGSLLEDAGNAAGDTLDHAGNAANDLLDGAGDVIDDVTNTTGTGR